MMKLYKVLGPKGESCHGGSGHWNMPKGSRPGKWMPKIENVVPCESGYHLCRLSDLPGWLGPVIWEAEGRGTKVLADDKVVFGQARLLFATGWNEKAARLFAADCAEHVLPIFEKLRPKDDRPRKAIEAARAFARGEISAAARDAARDAARAAAGAAARAAAGATAGDAARAAAWDAAWAAAGDAERKWQSQRLAMYLAVVG